MVKFPPELIAHKGNVFSLLYVAGGLLMTVTAGSRCVDVAVRTAQNPATLLRLSNTLMGFMGLRYQIHVANSTAKRKQKLKRLYFTDSLNSLLHMTRKTLRETHDLKVLCLFLVHPEKQTSLESTSTNGILARRSRIWYILICGVRNRPILTLCVGNDSSKMNTCRPANQLQWLINFSSEAHARGDVIFLLLGGQSGQMTVGSDTAAAIKEPMSLTLGLSALSAVLLWMFLPYIAVCAVICLGWKMLQSLK